MGVVGGRVVEMGDYMSEDVRTDVARDPETGEAFTCAKVVYPPRVTGSPKPYEPTEKDLRDVENLEISDLVGMRVFDLPENIPEEAKTILALKCYGLSNSEIARRLGMTEAGIRYHINRYDLNQITHKGTTIRKLLLSGMFEAIAMECLSKISRTDLKNMSPKDRLHMANLCIRAMDDLKIKSYESDKKTDQDIVKQLAAQ